MTTTGDEIWTDFAIDLAGVRAWISRALPGEPALEEGCRVLNRKDWSIVAEFRTAKTGDPVIYKVTTLPRLRHGPQIFGLLSRHCPGVTPAMIASRTAANGRAEMLFRKFAGEPVREFPRLLDAVRACARIQGTIGALPPPVTESLPSVRLADIPVFLETLLQEIEPAYEAFWDADGGALRAQFQVPRDIAGRGRDWFPRIWEWIAELEALGWPPSLDHVDLLPHNMVIQPDGAPLIFDWEQAEAGCPLFSLDVLLAYAQDWEKSVQHGLHLDRERKTAEWLAVRDAYLEALPWGSLAERRRAFELALCLSPIRYAYSEWVMAVEHGHQSCFAEDSAWWLMRACRRWQEMDR
jgi:hypothetical protein